MDKTRVRIEPDSLESLESRIARLEAWIPALTGLFGRRAEVSDNPRDWASDSCRQLAESLDPRGSSD